MCDVFEQRKERGNQRVVQVTNERSDFGSKVKKIIGAGVIAGAKMGKPKEKEKAMKLAIIWEDETLADGTVKKWFDDKFSWTEGVTWEYEYKFTHGTLQDTESSEKYMEFKAWYANSDFDKEASPQYKGWPFKKKAKGAKTENDKDVVVIDPSFQWLKPHGNENPPAISDKKANSRAQKELREKAREPQNKVQA